MKSKAELADELKRMHLQWFADGEEPEVDFEDDDDEEAEVIILKPGEKPPEDNEEDGAKEPEIDQVAALQARIDEMSKNVSGPSDISKAISEGLGNILNQSPRSDDTEPQRSGESDEDFAKRFAERIWKPGQEYDAFREAVIRIMAPYAQLTIGATVEQSKEILKMHPEKGPLFKRFEKEIDSRRLHLSPAQRNDPKVYDQLLTQVVAEHPELEEERINARVEEAVKQALIEHGIETGTGAATSKAPATYTEGSGSRTGGTTGRKKKRIYATEEDRRIAIEKGVPIQRVLEARYGRSE